MSPPFRRVAGRTVFDGALISVEAVTFSGPEQTAFEREIVHHPGAVVVVPLHSSGSVVMVRQFRAAIGRELLEIPAGKRDVQGEDTTLTAGRELAEEVGLQAGRLDLLACFYNSPGFCDEYTWLYLARDLTSVPDDRQGHEEQAMTIEEVALDDVGAMISSGQIVDAKSIIGLSLTREFLARP